MSRLFQHFDEAEFRCKCGKCPDDVLVSVHLLSGLETLRALAGNKPLKVISGIRCPAYNAKVRGAKRSAHLEGIAADVWTGSSVITRMMNDFAMQIHPFATGGIGLYRTFIHLDVRGFLGRRRARWSTLA